MRTATECCGRMVHVTRAACHIAYVQMCISLIFAIFFSYHYMLARATFQQLLFAVSVQLILVVLMLHGIRSERRSFLLPYLGYAIVAILAGVAQLGSDFVAVDRAHSAESKSYTSSQFAGHLAGTIIHCWCLSVIFKCYQFLGEQKVARQIAQQLSATQAAFHYPDQLLQCVMPQPPAYVDIVHANQTADALMAHEQKDEEKSLHVV
ncbi:hypothetical protein M3Y99_01669200 [Aphelenchoides fujianensis]|nr:hypothetical protein M3Y99_01669200 [Aphelenchoides fujianensis]